MTVTLLISTYNWPQALRLCLLSSLRQTHIPDEIVICDDGSTSETADVVREFQSICPVPVIHAWQEDKGFRLARSRNVGVAASSSDYIIQIDGDVMLHPHFIADHLSMAQPHTMLRGRRLTLGESVTHKLCQGTQLPRLDFFCEGVTKRRFNAIHLPWLAKQIASRYRKNRPGIMGCNMSFWRADFEAVNGYDETFEGWGSEDSDLASRMQLNGVMKHDLKFAAICFHLFHGHPAMHNREKNQAYSKRTLTASDIYARKGLDSHRSSKP